MWTANRWPCADRLSARSQRSPRPPRRPVSPQATAPGWLRPMPECSAGRHPSGRSHTATPPRRPPPGQRESGRPRRLVRRLRSARAFRKRSGAASDVARLAGLTCRRSEMDLCLRGRTALVGGASSGLGRATAERLAAEGCRLALWSRGGQLLEQAATEIRGAHSVEVTTIAGDAGAPAPAAFVAAAAQKAPVSYT